MNITRRLILVAAGDAALVALALWLALLPGAGRSRWLAAAAALALAATVAAEAVTLVAWRRARRLPRGAVAAGGLASALSAALLASAALSRWLP